MRKQIQTAIAAILLIAGLLSLRPIPALAAAAWADNCYVASEGACVIDADSKVVLFGKNEDTAYYPASITKVMTALITLENCSDLNEIVTFSQSAVAFEEEDSTIIGASEGDRLTVRDCLYSLLFQSANEVANALSEHVGAKHPELRQNSESNRAVFVRMMNQKAEALGCKGTHFNNPSGLTDENHYTTPYDMCLILAAAIENDAFLDIESHSYWKHAPIKRYPNADDPWNTVYQKHQMLRRSSSQYYEGALAGKTGYTMTAGNTLVTASRRDGMTLVACVMNAHNNHYNDTRRLLDFGYSNFRSVRITDFDSTHSAVESDLSLQGLSLMDAETIGIAEQSRITLPKDADTADVTKELEADAGQTEADGTVQRDSGAASVGARMVYRYDGRVVGKAELQTMELGGQTAMLLAEEDPLLNTSLGAAAPKTLETDGNAQAEAGTDAAQTDHPADAAQSGSAEAASANGGSAAALAGTDGKQTATDKKGAENALGLPPLALTILKIAGAVLTAGFVILLVLFQREKKEAAARAKRRAQRLKHTRDLTGQQNIKMDMLVQQSLRKKKRKK